VNGGRHEVQISSDSSAVSKAPVRADADLGVFQRVRQAASSTRNILNTLTPRRSTFRPLNHSRIRFQLAKVWLTISKLLIPNDRNFDPQNS